MTTKFNKRPVDTFGENALFGANMPDDYQIPSCGVEDVDRALFNLFNSELPLFYESKGEQERVPCIFATGERAFILRRKKPLTDRHGALILPMVSILRSGLDQAPDSGFGIGPGEGSIILRKRVHPDTTELANELNRLGLLNQGNVVTENKHVGPSIRGYSRALPVGTGFLDLEPSTKVVETITIPSVRFFKATYEVTFWTQYLQQMNELLEAMMVSYSWNPARAFRIETDKGYWFVANVESDISSQLNFDEFTDDERIVQYSITIGVNGYIINPKYSGNQNMVRRTLSAPKVSFDSGIGIDLSPANVPVASGDAADYMFEDYEEEGAPIPGSGIGKSTSAASNDYQAGGQPGISGVAAGAGANSRLPVSGVGGSAAADAAASKALTHGKGVSVGGQRKLSDSEVLRIENFKDPFTGKVEKKIVKIKTSSTKFGEKVVNPLNVGD